MEAVVLEEVKKNCRLSSFSCPILVQFFRYEGQLLANRPARAQSESLGAPSINRRFAYASSCALSQFKFHCLS